MSLSQPFGNESVLDTIEFRDPVTLKDISMPPSINNAYPTGAHGKRFKSAEYRKWEESLKTWGRFNSHILNNARRTFNTPRAGFFIDLHCSFKFEKSKILTLDHRPKICDLDNRIKIIIDGITKLIGFDDKWIFSASFDKRPIEGFSRCDISLRWKFPAWQNNL